MRQTPAAEEMSPFAGAESGGSWGDAPGPVRAEQIMPRIGLAAETAKIEGARAKQLAPNLDPSREF
ncbi:MULTISPECIES: hypothetical protein [unclassified Streptomyces]|uniref:hypothetical protein n=1 Tax=unclassified Streptomyces TaxID=2593676 RepID=UPI003422AC3D